MKQGQLISFVGDSAMIESADESHLHYELKLNDVHVDPMEYISEESRQMIVLPEGVAEGEIVQNISQEAEDLHAEIWNQFKDACD